MKRREFITTAALSGAAGITGTLHGSKAVHAEEEKMLRLDGYYYRHYPVDFSKETEGALGFKGWADDPLEIATPVKETALVPMHVWNIGIDPSLPFTSDGPAGGVMDMLEWASRSKEIIKEYFPALFEATRNAGIPIIHVASGESYASKYPGYARAKEIAGPPPEGIAHAPSRGNYEEKDRIALLFGERYNEYAEYYSSKVDFPPQAKPADDEYVVINSHQLSEVCREQGIWNLIYVGFAINWCLWFSPGGMVDMSRAGYQCSVIEEAVTAVENHESVEGEFNKQQAMWRTSLMFGYVHHLDNYMAECRRLADG